jgi:nucleotide-binding universal stress UspA family protein
MSFRTILVPVDFSDHAKRALELAIELAGKFDGDVHLLHCYQINVGGMSPYGLAIPENFDREVRAAAEARLDDWAEKARAAGGRVHTDVSPLFPATAISERAREINADLIVMGTRGLTGLKHLLLGSVAERTLQTAPCPVLTLKADED